MYDVIIIGSGPAGLTAGIYTARADLKTLIIAGTKWGGQLQLTTLIENFPGFPTGIQGPELMSNMRKQAEHFGAEVVDVDFSKGNFSAPPAGGPFKITAGGKEYESRAIIIATGADPKWLGVPGEKELIGHGVSTCAPCDAFFFKGKSVIVVGGGNSAMEEALTLTKFANKVTVVHRRDKLRATQVQLIDECKKNPKISFLLNTEVVEVLGDTSVKGVKIKDTKTNKISEIPIDGIFVAVGRTPNSKVFQAVPAGRQGIDVDQLGYVKVFDHLKTNIEGVFVAGDVSDNYYQQAIVAAGCGGMAALEVLNWLEDRK
ncbi:MAG: Thioredoxin reductase [Candidatus Levybacteria bacterium]|nr:Thioredoxin reductase [Candidatus Levybacteria bacterium]